MVRFAYIGKERDKRNLRLLTTFGHDTAAQERWTILTVSAALRTKRTDRRFRN